ncbi:MAG TPA: hypothetical protein VI248_21280 [Kineosporiaceae bacterium]
MTESLRQATSAGWSCSPPGTGSALGVPLAVHGGPGGTAARLDDLELAALRLQRSAQVMALIAARLARIAMSPASALTAVRSPATWWAAQQRLATALGGQSGAVVVAARYAALAGGALAAVALYRAAELASDAVVRAADVSAGEAVGRLLAAPGMVGTMAALPMVLPWLQPVLLPELRSGAATSPGDGGPVPSPGPLLRGLAAHPGVVEHVVDGLPGMFRGLTGSPAGLLLAAGVTGRPVAPLDVPGAARWVGSVGRRLPYLRESTSVSIRPGPASTVPPPRGLAELVGGLADLDPVCGAVPGSVALISVTGAPGRRAWIVQIPGTQSWSPRAGSDPLDLTGNIHGMAGDPTAAAEVVTEALASAGARPADPVLLVGYSQGGIVAAHLAADPSFRRRFAVSHVVTVGAPVAVAAIPGSVPTLSLEHDHDLVPRLDGAVNPDHPSWITVTAPAEPAGAPPDAVLSHDLGSYRRTAVAVDASNDPGLLLWRSGLAPFLAGDGTTAARLVVVGERRIAG